MRTFLQPLALTALAAAAIFTTTAAQARGGVSVGVSVGHAYHGGGYYHGGYRGGYRGGYYRGGYWGPGPFWGGVGIGIGLGAVGYYGNYYNGYYAPYDAAYYDDGVVTSAPVVVSPSPATTYSSQTYPSQAVRSGQAVPANGRSNEPIFYGKNGQSAAKTEADRQDCNRWASTQQGALGDASIFQRATYACMEGRGYTVR